MRMYRVLESNYRIALLVIDANASGNKSSKCWTDSKGVVQTKRVKWGDDGEEYYVLLTAS